MHLNIHSCTALSAILKLKALPREIYPETYRATDTIHRDRATATDQNSDQENDQKNGITQPSPGKHTVR